MYFAPYQARDVGILNTASNTFSTLDVGLAVNGNKYSGAATVGVRVFFTPWEKNDVGILDTTTNAWSTVAASSRFYGSGAIAIGLHVYMTSSYGTSGGDNVATHTAIYDTVSGSLTTVPNPGGITFDGLAAVARGQKLVFSPSHSNVGVMTCS